jgi:hypothetical protein
MIVGSKFRWELPKLRVNNPGYLAAETSGSTQTYTVMKNFRFLLAKHSVLINTPKLLNRCFDFCSGIDFEPKDPGFKPHTAQKRRTKFQGSLGSSLTRLKKEEQNFKVLPDEQNPESTFSRIQIGNNIRNFGSWIWWVIFRDRNFGFDKNYRNLYRSLGWVETGEFSAVSGENE